MKIFKNSKIIFILITMFLNFLGFSIVIPVLPFLVGKYTSDPNLIAWNVGLILSIFAFCQFFAAPGLGALSDRFGRRPILLISLLGSVIGYIIMGIGGSIWILFLGRIIDGITGGNISTVYSYLADITEPKDRGKYYGMLGAAGGFGFIIGPALGGLFAHISISAPLFLAAGVTFINMLWGYFILPESLSKEHRSGKLNLTHLNPFSQFSHVFSLQILRRIFLFGFIFLFAMYCTYGNNAVFMKDVFNWGPSQIGILLFIVGVIDVFSQGFLVRKLMPILHETKVGIIGIVLVLIGFITIVITAVTNSLILFYIAIIILNIGDGLFEPSYNSLVSKSVGPKMQGRVQGANQGMQSIGRVIAPLFSAWVYGYWRGLPFVLESIFALIALLVFIYSLPLIRTHKVQE
jgi:MFS transporter, DHA1 family, tetracycline resistance protein